MSDRAGRVFLTGDHGPQREKGQLVWWRATSAVRAGPRRYRALLNEHSILLIHQRIKGSKILDALGGQYGMRFTEPNIITG
jgi:hypothetical protein